MDKETFLVEDYKLKVEYTTQQFARMWTRFNFLLTFESVLMVAVTAKVGGQIEAGSRAVIAIIGLATSLFWYAVGSEDRYLVLLYRAQQRLVYQALASTYETLAFPATGEVDKWQFDKNESLRAAVKVDFLQWRYDQLSTTRLAALFPLLVAVAWIVIIALLPTWRS